MTTRAPTAQKTRQLCSWTNLSFALKAWFWLSGGPLVTRLTLSLPGQAEKNRKEKEIICLQARIGLGTRIKVNHQTLQIELIWNENCNLVLFQVSALNAACLHCIACRLLSGQNAPWKSLLCSPETQKQEVYIVSNSTWRWYITFPSKRCLMYSWTKLEVVLIEWTKFSSSGSVSMSGLTWGHLLIPKFHCQLISPHRSQSLEILKNLENYCFGPCQRQMLLNFIFWFSQMISGLKALNRTILQSHCVTHDSSILKSSPNSGSTCLSVVKSAIHWVWRGRKGKTNTDTTQTQTEKQTDTYLDRQGDQETHQWQNRHTRIWTQT